MTQPLATDPGARPVLDHHVVRASDPEVSLREIVRVVRENLRKIVLAATVVAVVVGVGVFVSPRIYTSTASFLPEVRRGGGLSGLAQQYGISLPGAGGDPGQSLQFYMELVRSREILTQLVTDTLRYDSRRGSVRVPVADFLEAKGATQAERVEDGVFKLRGMIDPSASMTTGIVRIAVTTKSPEVSQALAQRMLDLINDFNLGRRQSQGASERRFAERRLAEMTDSLRAAEFRLQEFEQRNAQYMLSPHLRTEHRRLMSNLGSKQALHTALAQAYEQARMEEVRDTPVITTLERPIVPSRPDSRRGVQKVMLAFIGTLALGLVIVFARENARIWSSVR